MTMRRGTLLCALAALVACRDEAALHEWPIPDARAPLEADTAEPPPPAPPPPTASAPPPPATPAPEVPAFEEGYLERHPSACWMAPAPPEPCPARGICTQTIPSWARVTCPPTLAKHDKKHLHPAKNLPPLPRRGYTERVVQTNRCYHATRRPSCETPAKCNLAATEVRCP
jgi:hypothetical protein